MASPNSEVSWSTFENPSEPNPSELRQVVGPKPEHEVRPTFMLGILAFTLNFDDLSFIQARFGVPLEYELELPGSDGKICSLPLGQLGLYSKAFRARLRLLIPSF